MSKRDDDSLPAIFYKTYLMIVHWTLSGVVGYVASGKQVGRLELCIMAALSVALYLVMLVVGLVYVAFVERFKPNWWNPAR